VDILLKRLNEGGKDKGIERFEGSEFRCELRSDKARLRLSQAQGASGSGTAIDRLPISLVPVRLQDNSSASPRLGSHKLQPNMKQLATVNRWNLQSS
jgi:hypothetical protein